MRQVKIEYENFEREENKARVAEIVLAYAWLFPVWLKTLTVAVFDEQEGKEDFNGWSEGQPEYGTATIGLRTLCMDKPDVYLAVLVVHELIHIAHMKVFEHIKRTIGMAKESNPELYNFLEEDLRQRDEEFIEHMAVGLVEFAHANEKSSQPPQEDESEPSPAALAAYERFNRRREKYVATKGAKL